jgi:hypothetical protein
LIVNEKTFDSTTVKKTSKKEYADMLASCQLESIERLNQKNNQLTRATKSARSAAMAAKVYVKSVEDYSKRENGSGG